MFGGETQYVEILDAVPAFVEGHQPLAILLRNCYERHPELRLLLDALGKEGSADSLPRLGSSVGSGLLDRLREHVLYADG